MARKTRKPAPKPKSKARAASKPKAVRPIPDSYPVLTPYLTVKGAARAIDYYVRAFGAKERMRMPGPEGSIGHAELQLGTSVLMLSDEFPALGAVAPPPGGPTPLFLTMYVKDVDAVFTRAVELGATVKQPIENKFYGDRTGMIVDPFGHSWCLMTHIEDVSPAEMSRRAAAVAAAPASGI